MPTWEKNAATVALSPELERVGLVLPNLNAPNSG
jgi:hypothetical protein